MTLSVGNSGHGRNAEPLAVGHGSLSGLPDEMIRALFSFDPDFALISRAVSRELKQISEDFLQRNRQEIVALCCGAGSLLYSRISSNFIHFGQSSSASEGGIDVQFHLSLPAEVRSLGVSRADCPNRILVVQEIDRLNARVQTIHDIGLQRMWGCVHRIAVYSHHLAGVPAVGAPAQEMRTWMHANPTVLQGLTQLRLADLGLTCVPRETGLCTGLQKLFLHNNGILSLPGGIFSGLTGLQELWLNNNGLLSVPEGLFQGLVELKELELSVNRLVSLPEGLFQGLPSLKKLYLHNNQLASLPGGLLHGLTKLKSLNLGSNQLCFLPPGLFHDLKGLQTFYLHGNPGLLMTWHPCQFFVNCLEYPGVMDLFFNYACQTPFAAFYQLVAGGHSPAALRESFSGLDDGVKSDILSLVHKEAGRSSPNDLPGRESDPLEDMRIFHSALRAFVREKFAHLSVDQKTEVYDRVSLLAKNEREAEGYDCSSTEWGRRHAFDNILRCIDAMFYEPRGIKRHNSVCLNDMSEERTE